MRLIDLQQHFFNNDVKHAERLKGWGHDVYKNPKNSREFTIPINEPEIPDEFCNFACYWLGIEGIDGKPFLSGGGSSQNVASA